MNALLRGGDRRAEIQPGRTPYHACLVTSATAPPQSADTATLREVVEALAPLERRAGSEGEREAAHWIADRLREAGCQAEVEEEQFLDGYARLIGMLAAGGAIAAAAGLTRRWRKLGGLAGAAVTAAIADDISNGPRVFRRATSAPLTTWNVIASCGDPEAERTLVVLAHHDAAPTGAIFDPRAQAWLGRDLPRDHRADRHLAAAVVGDAERAGAGHGRGAERAARTRRAPASAARCWRWPCSPTSPAAPSARARTTT